MLPRVRLGSLIRRYWIVAAAALAVCALEAIPGAVAGLDADSALEQAEAAAPAPPSAGNTLSSRAERRRLRRLKRVGGPQSADGGAVDGGASHDGGLWRATARDGGIRPPVVAAPPPPPPPPPPGPPSTAMPISELGFNTCHKLPAGKRAVKATLKPDIELPELIAWISSITCKSFVLPSNLSGGGKKVTLYTQGMMTRREAYAAFLAALDSIGLTVEQAPGFLRVIETSKAKTGSVPVYGFDGRPASR